MNIPSKIIDSSESDPKDIRRMYEFLRSQSVASLATVDTHSNPHMAVVYFSVSEDFSITFVTKRDTQKHDNIKKNNHVALLIYEALSQTTLQVSGVAKEITDPAKGLQAFDAMLKSAANTSEAGSPPISKLYASHYVAYMIDPVQIRMAMFVSTDPGDHDIFKSINFET